MFLVGKLSSFSFPCIRSKQLIFFILNVTSIQNFAFLLDIIYPQLINWSLIFPNTNTLIKDSHYMGRPLRPTKTISSALIDSLIAISWYFSWENFLKNVTIVLSFVNFILCNLFLKSHFLLRLLVSNRPIKALYIFLIVFNWEIWGIKWSFTKSINILFSLASFFLCFYFPSSSIGLGMTLFT